MEASGSWSIWARLVSFSIMDYNVMKTDAQLSYYSSARDQLSHRTVAVKKLAEPFKTQEIARHMFREIKLLRQLRHENVRFALAFREKFSNSISDNQLDRYIHLSLRRHVLNLDSSSTCTKVLMTSDTS